MHTYNKARNVILTGIYYDKKENGTVELGQKFVFRN